MGGLAPKRAPSKSRYGSQGHNKWWQWPHQVMPEWMHKDEEEEEEREEEGQGSAGAKGEGNDVQQLMQDEQQKLDNRTRNAAGATPQVQPQQQEGEGPAAVAAPAAAPAAAATWGGQAYNVQKGHRPWKNYSRTWQPERCPNCADAGIGPQFCGWSELRAKGLEAECKWDRRPEGMPYPDKPRCYTCRETGHRARECTNVSRMQERAKMDPTYY